jgi:hypothetical protein
LDLGQKERGRESGRGRGKRNETRRKGKSKRGERAKIEGREGRETADKRG